MTEFNNYFTIINGDGDKIEIPKSEVIKRLNNILNWCNDNHAYADADALDIAIAIIKDIEE